MEIEKVVKMLELLKEFQGTATAETVTDKNDPLIGKLVLIRTYASGVHFGELLRNDGRLVELKNARRIWYWEKAFTLNQVATNGISGNSKVSLAVDFIRILDGIEIIPIKEKIYQNLITFETEMSK